MHELDSRDVLHYTLSAVSLSTTLNYFDRRTTNGFAEGCHTKNKVLERVSYGLRNVDVYLHRRNSIGSTARREVETIPGHDIMKW
ncbi:unnamed protein product [marine sediment metagenome]|uniref:Transposase IS204/IS1001/IS1096/IS1165 DDE domain-containing protein n=1 Tax=marine sediment metagenome TaxID=412755 RepID=X0WJC7_9ZZZZ